MKRSTCFVCMGSLPSNILELGPVVPGARELEWRGKIGLEGRLRPVCAAVAMIGSIPRLGKNGRKGKALPQLRAEWALPSAMV